jgi:molybdopterin converting factor small subunit
MTIIRFYGRAAAALGREVQLMLPVRGCTIAEIRRSLAQRYAHHSEELLSLRLRPCIDDGIVAEDCIVRDDQEVEFLPPVSGG